MPTFITPDFLEKIQSSGRLFEAIQILERMNRDEKSALPSLATLSSWELVLEEVLDTDHDQPYYVGFVYELLRRGYSKEDIQTMRVVAWNTAGWYNFEMMAWDWCFLHKEDMILGLEHRFNSGDINMDEKEAFMNLITQYENPPNRVEGHG